MKLYCVRHGEACSPDVDPQRGLTAQGLKEVGDVARHLSNHAITIHQILHSGKARAEQTAETLAQALNVSDIEASPQLLAGDGEIEPMMEWLKATDEDAMIVGHLPFLPRLINGLLLANDQLPPVINFTPGTVICMSRVAPEIWTADWLLPPSIVSTN